MKITTIILSLISILFIVLLINKLTTKTFDFNDSYHFSDNHFFNPYLESSKTFSDFMKWIFNRQGNRPKYNEIKNIYQVFKPDFDVINKTYHEDLHVTWLGHSTNLLQFNEINLLTDPILSKRCSPVQFAGPQRYTHAPLNLEELPKIDYVVISHNHYDHLDLNTVQFLGNKPKWLVPLGLKFWFNNIGIENVVELDWWEDFKMHDLIITCTPAQHFSGRGLFDRNATLWASWAIENESFNIWFGGDTGYSKQFKDIGNRLGPFDLALIPIGAYNPRWFMSSMHVDPYYAVEIHKDINSTKSIGIHWGTFVLTDEPVEEPPELLKKIIRSQNMNLDSFITLQHGETLTIKEK